MTQWAVVVDPNGISRVDAMSFSVNATVVFIDDATNTTGGFPIAGQGLASLGGSNTPFPMSDLDDPQSFVVHVIARVIALGPSVAVPAQYPGGTTDEQRDHFTEIDAAHVSFLPPYLPAPPPPPSVPSGVIAVLVDTAPIPTGWALCDGTNGTPDLTDVFRPKDHAVYIQKL